MKVAIDKDEWYPVYYLVSSDYHETTEVNKQVVERWKKVFIEFDKVQEEMRRVYKDV